MDGDARMKEHFKIVDYETKDFIREFVAPWGIDFDYEAIECVRCCCFITSYSSWESHVNGKNHLQKVIKHKASLRNMDTSEICPPRVPMVKTKMPDRVFDTIEEFYRKNPKALIMGLKFIREIFKSKSSSRPPVYNCVADGCSSAWGKARDMWGHIQGERHYRSVLAVSKSQDLLASLTRNQIMKFALDNQTEDDKNFSKMERIINEDEYDNIARRPHDWKFREPKRSKIVKKEVSMDFGSFDCVPIPQRELEEKIINGFDVNIGANNQLLDEGNFDQNVLKKLQFNWSVLKKSMIDYDAKIARDDPLRPMVDKFLMDMKRLQNRLAATFGDSFTF